MEVTSNINQIIEVKYGWYKKHDLMADISIETIEKVDKRFYEVATMVNYNRVRRRLLCAWQFSVDEWTGKVAAFSEDDGEAFVELVEAGAEHIKTVRKFADMLESGMCHVINGFSENGYLGDWFKVVSGRLIWLD